MPAPVPTTASPLVGIRSRLTAALLSDVLDGLGYRAQALPPRIRPLDDASVMAGRARTALFMDVYDVDPDENPYELEIALIDSLQPDEVPVFSCGGTGRIAPWGELLTTASKTRGAAGALMDGLVRDIRAIRATGFPVFHGGIGPLDSKGRGKIVALDVPVECAGVRVCPGDLVFGDADGVIVVPRAIEAKALAGAWEKLAGEHSTLADLRAGLPLGEVYAKYEYFSGRTRHAREGGIPLWKVRARPQSWRLCVKAGMTGACLQQIQARIE